MTPEAGLQRPLLKASELVPEPIRRVCVCATLLYELASSSQVTAIVSGLPFALNRRH